MPNVTAPARLMGNGEVVTQFTDTTSTAAVTYTYPVQQAHISIENNGTAVIYVTIGSYTNQAIQPNTKWEVDVSYNTFSIRSDGKSQKFIATAFQNDIEGGGEADLVARALALSKATVHAKQFGAKGDGVTPDDDAFDKIAQFFEDKPGAIVEFDTQGVYLIERNHYFPSNVNLHFNGATLWSRCDSGGVDNSQDRNIGMLNFWGTLDPVKTTITSAAGLEGDWKGVDNTSLPHDGKITLADASAYQVGDFIYLDISTGSYSSSKLNPKEKKVLKIIYKAGNTLTVDYTSPWRYQDYTFTGTVQKCYPCRDITIRDVNIFDELVVTAPKDPNINTPGTENFVSCLSFNYAYNIDVRRVTGKNTKFPIVHVFNTSYGVVEDGYVEKPATVGSGEGYFSQFVHCKNIDVRRVYGDESRHVVDFTNSAFCTVDTAIGYKTYSTAFQMHGHYEHDITWRNVVGNMGASSGQSFGEANTRILLDNHTGWLSGSYMKDYKVRNSKIRMKKLPYGVIENSEVWFQLDDPYTQDTRIPKANRKTELVNCNTEIYGGSNTTSVLSTMALLTFRGGRLVNTKDPTTGFTLQAKDIDLQIRDMHEIRGVLISLEGTVDARCSIDDSVVYSGQVDNYILQTKNASGGCKLLGKLSNIKYVNERAGGLKGKLTRMPSADASVTGVTQQLIMQNCEIDNAVILGELVSGAANDMHLSTGNLLTNTTRTVDATIPHYKVDDLVI